MTPEDVARLIARGENEQVEFKSSIPAPPDLAREIASLANTKGGTLVLGVSEPGEVVGIDEHRARELIASAQRYLSKPLPVAVNHLHVHGHPVVVARVDPSPDLVAASGGYYGRGPQAHEVKWDSATRQSRPRRDTVRPLSAEEIIARVSALDSNTEAVNKLSEAVATQTKTIDQLRQDFDKANAPWKKIVIALVGAAFGALLKYLADLFL